MNTNESDDDETEIVLATRELILATQTLLIATDTFDEFEWWPLHEAEQACATYCSWSGDRLPIRSVAHELRTAAADLRSNAL